MGDDRCSIGVVDNILKPIAAKPRIQALDVIRGVSILGILAVNADGYAAPITASLKPSAWPFPNVASTAIAYRVMDTFFHEKFLTLFSMLFGISLFLVGGERNDKEKGRILRRLLGDLFLFEAGVVGMVAVPLRHGTIRMALALHDLRETGALKTYAGSCLSLLIRSRVSLRKRA